MCMVIGTRLRSSFLVAFSSFVTLACAETQDEETRDALLLIDGEDRVLAVIQLDDGSTYEFIALTDDDGIIIDVGVHVFGGGGALALDSIEGFDVLNALEIFNGLSREGAAPEALELLYEDPEQRSRGWLAAGLSGGLAPRAYCTDSWFLYNHGDSQTYYDEHPGPDSGAWTNTYITYLNVDPFKYTRYDIDKVKTGGCHQSGTYFVWLDIAYKTGSLWNYVVEEQTFPGDYHWWWCNTCTNYDWQIVVDTGWLQTAYYDIGYDYTP